jgi:hypothetical protein
MEKLDQINKFKRELNWLEALPQHEKLEPPFVKHHSKLVYIMHITFIAFIGLGLLTEGASVFAFTATMVLGFALIMSMKTHDIVADIANNSVKTIEEIVKLSEKSRIKRIDYLKSKIEEQHG